MIRLMVGNGSRMRQVKVPFWGLALAGGAVVLVSMLLLAFLASLAVVIIPACLIGAGAAHWFGRRGEPRGEPIFTQRRPADPNIIEGEYRVLDEKRR